MECKNHKNLHRISATDFFDLLKAMCDCNELFMEILISINHSEQVRESIGMYNKEIDEAMIVTLGKNIHDVDIEKTGYRCGKDTFLDVTDF